MLLRTKHGLHPRMPVLRPPSNFGLVKWGEDGHEQVRP